MCYFVYLKKNDVLYTLKILHKRCTSEDLNRFSFWTLLVYPQMDYTGTIQIFLAQFYDSNYSYSVVKISIVKNNINQYSFIILIYNLVNERHIYNYTHKFLQY